MLGSVAALLVAALIPGIPGDLPIGSSDGGSAASSSILESAAQELCLPTLVARSGNASVSVDPVLLGSVGPAALLANLSVLTRAELSEFVVDNRTVVRDLIANPPAPERVQSWWAELPGTAQRALLEGAPEIIGNLEGLPYGLRDLANRAFLDQELDRMTAALTGQGKGAREITMRRIGELERVDAAVGSVLSSPERRLLTLDTTGSIRAAISFGDLETADFVSLLVPGMYMSVATTIGPWTDTAAYVYDYQENFQRIFRDDRTFAVVSWIGYQTPDIGSVFTPALAEEGANYLANAVNGLKEVRADNQPYLSVLAHSYGATATMMALERGTMSLSALAMVGSPGSTAESASELAVPIGKVWVGEAAWDPVVGSGYYGSDPGSSEYGAKKMSVAGVTDPLTGEYLRGSVGHNDYLEPHTESLRNMALIGIDRVDWVTNGTAADASKTAPGSTG